MAAKLWALYQRDWRQDRSYRLAFITRMVSGAMPLVLLVFLARLFRDTHIAGIAKYGGDYPAFLLFGAAVTTYSVIALNAFSSGLRQAQMAGTLETLLMTRASPFTIILGWSLYPYSRATLHLLVFVLGWFLLTGLNLSGVNLLSALATFLLTVLVMASLGLVGASFTLVFKQGDPFTSAIVAASALLSGVAYPVDVLPAWLQGLSVLLPQTHALEAMRLALMQGYSIPQLAAPLGALALFAAFLLPMAIVILRMALHRARSSGSLAHY